MIFEEFGSFMVFCTMEKVKTHMLHPAHVFLNIKSCPST